MSGYGVVSEVPVLRFCRLKVPWRQAGAWDRIIDAPAAGQYAVVMIDTSVVRMQQREAYIADNNHQDMGRSRGSLTSTP
jgi:hypothetical protein